MNVEIFEGIYVDIIHALFWKKFFRGEVVACWRMYASRGERGEETFDKGALCIA